jgi:cell division protein FtsZ
MNLENPDNNDGFNVREEIHSAEADGSIELPPLPKILVIGVGGAGNNCIDSLVAHKLQGAKTVAINTDKQHLKRIDADYKILIGIELTSGMGTGADPALGAQCAKASSTEIRQLFDDVELVFLIAGMGGGTGTGAVPVIAQLARSLGVIVIAVVTMPFYFEYGRKHRARQGLRRLAASAHSLLVIDNNKLLNLASELPLNAAFNQIDDLITEIVSGITETMTTPSLINLDFADIKTIMRNGKLTLISYGKSDTLDPNEIVKNTLNNPLLNIKYDDASSALIHITGGPKLSLQLTNDITKTITKKLKPKANVILGARVNPEFDEEIKLFTIMTGINASPNFDYTNGLDYDTMPKI